MARPGWIESLTTIASGLAPGALLGTHLAGLIFFLNPHLPFAPVPLLRGVLVYGGLVGLASLALHLPFTWRRSRQSRRWLPWALTLAFATAAWLDASHASLYAFYLPAGINDRLIRTAIWLAVAALISFYTALLHTLHRRRYGWRSRYGYVLLAVLSIFAMVERRESFRPRPPRVHRAAVVESRQRPRLFVVGLDSATLDAILPLAGQGRLPFLATVLEQGAHGRLESIAPTWREALWISLATGKYPFRHGVTRGTVVDAPWLAPGAELRLLPIGIRFRSWGIFGQEARLPRTYPRHALALWEILPRLGLPAGIVGWPASGPESEETVFALPERDFAGRRKELDPALRTRFGAQPPAWLVDAMAGDLLRESRALSLFDQHPETRALFVVLPGLRAVSRGSFGGFHAVQFEGEQSAPSRQAAERLGTYLSALDSFLGQLWLRAEGPRVLAVVSAYGTQSRQDPLHRERTEVEGSFGDAPDGILLLYGEGIHSGALLTRAKLVDVAPTLLYALDFPVAQDLDGRVLTEAFQKGFLARQPLTILPSYEGLAPSPPAPLPAARPDPRESVYRKP